MPEIIETTVYRLDELSDAAKEKARAWYRQTGFDHDWFEFVYDDFECICAIIGVDLKTVPVRLYGGGTRQKPCIWFSGFWSQGDGACFEGRYGYAKDAPRKIRDHAPKDGELHRIADALQAIQRRNFYQLHATVDPPRSLLPRILHGDLGRARQPDRPGHDGRRRRDRHRGAARSRALALSPARTRI